MYRRKLFPTDYLRKEEMIDRVYHYVYKDRVELEPETDNINDLPHYYIKCERVAFTIEDIDDQQLISFQIVEYKNLVTCSFEKLNKIASFYVKLLVKWCKTYDGGGYTKRVHHDKVVPRDLYTENYRALKRKYQYWVKEWKESTDPQKFVFEDIAIAAFLISLWQIDTPYKKPSFVDLGAGNGFLVYLLTMEGYEGYGIDIQKRKIWDEYPENVKIIEAPIHPQEVTYDVDWIIGNHSDELTPWIPLIASRNNKKFFTLPCCEWDFDKKFTSRTQKMSRYNLYLEYIKKITEKCGYEVEVEHLRIPSTRNISIIGRIKTIDNDAIIKENHEKLLSEAGYTNFEPRFRSQAKHNKRKKNTK